MMWILITIAAVVIVSYFMLKRPHQYWTERGVKQSKPMLLFGDSWGVLSRMQSFGEMVQKVYNMHPNSRYSGMYQFLIPTLVLRDPDLIKQITVKDFDHFLDHRPFLPEDSDPFWSNNLFTLRGQRWREMRSTLSPAFTSSKMKQMFVLISDAAEEFVKYFLKQDKELITIEMKDTYTRFANDVIASTAFGINCDSLGERNNEFFLMGKEATDFGKGLWKGMKLFGYLIVPSICKIFKVKVFSTEVSNFFHNIITTNIRDRERHGIVRPDMIHLLMEARKDGMKHDETSALQDAGFATVEESEVGKAAPRSKVEITDQQITAQALGFFFAGFDSVSSLMCFCSYELGINPDVQERLRQEVDDTFEACNGKLTYEALLGMKYMDMVVSESLRLWPNAVAVDRVCTKPYTIQPQTPDEKPLHLVEGDVLWLPIFGIHRDPEHYENPTRFDPERFSDENKGNIKPYTYLPFGSGPRNCLGSRFALLEAKALFFHILRSFEIVRVKETKVPLRLNRQSFNMNAEDGFWFGLKRRVHK